MNINFTEGTSVYMEGSQHQSIHSAIDAASALAIDIRTSQYFKDGNHRTCLLALALCLAEYGVVFTSSFHMYRAYIIVSARFHPGNESNTLDANARADALNQLVRYLRQRTVRGVADAEYLATVADAVRQLPIIVSHVEEVGARLGKERMRPSRVWASLNLAQRVVMRWTFPELNKGTGKIR